MILKLDMANYVGSNNLTVSLSDKVDKQVANSLLIRKLFLWKMNGNVLYRFTNQVSKN
jgi:hypothetical protein